jgi:hypothetical protein
MHESNNKPDIRTPDLSTKKFAGLAPAFTLPKQDWLCSFAEAKNGGL